MMTIINLHFTFQSKMCNFFLKKNILLLYSMHMSPLDLAYFTINTTPLNSFTDGLIPSVLEMKSVGEILTDGKCPSVY